MAEENSPTKSQSNKQKFQINFNSNSFIDLATYFIEREFNVKIVDVEFFCYGDYGRVSDGEKHWEEEVRVTVQKESIDV